ncbi:MAG: hypothetical protein JXX29_15485 [Deltaproteobacteria bacterium]|nr:hypothetical protein [Deltaproteobacteria bacterium]MBN2673085.1 hypothetical protein [Deltaproteobacteria bacterium]
MSIKTIYLHAGFHKTGTSTIQNVLFAHHADLASIGEGYFYSPTLARNHSIPLYSLFCDHPDKYHINIKNGLNSVAAVEEFNSKIRENLTQELQTTSCRNIIFSGEDVSKLTKENLVSLKAYFEEVIPNARIEVLLSTREPASYAASGYQEATKNGFSVTMDRYIEQARDFFRLNVRKFFQVFGKAHVHVFKFEDAREHRAGLIGDFLDRIGIEQDAQTAIVGKEETQANVSVSYEVVRLVEHINLILPLMVKGTIGVGRRRDDIAQMVGLRGDKFQLTPVQVRRMNRASLSDRQWLREKTGIDYPDAKNVNRTNDTVWSTSFCDDFFDVFPNLTEELQLITFRFLSALRENKNVAVQPRKRLAELNRKLIQTYPQGAQGERIVPKMKARILNRANNSFRHFEEFIGAVDGLPSIPPAVFYRELALLCKAHNQDVAALHFMKQAKRFNPSGTFILQKIREWNSQGNKNKRKQR